MYVPCFGRGRRTGSWTGTAASEYRGRLIEPLHLDSLSARSIGLFLPNVGVIFILI